MKKFAEEVVKYFWIPLIMALVSYIFFQLKDVVLGIIVLVGLSAVYTLVRLYFIHKKWWLLIILMVVVGASVGAYYLRAPMVSLTINGEKITSAQVSINGGSVQVNPTPFNGLFSRGTVVTLTANPGSGEDWESWVGTENDSTNPTTVKMDNAKQIRVNFASRYSLIINNEIVIGSFLSFTEGDISVNPAPGGDGKYTSGTEVTLSVRPNTGYDWTSWSGTSNDNTNPTTVVMSGGNKNVTVNFEGRFMLTIGDQLIIGPSVTLPNGSVTVDPAPGNDDKYAYGTKITLTANADTGYGWKSWSGTGNDSSNPATITINSDKHIAVYFEERYMVMLNNRAVNSETTGFAGGTVTADPAPGTDARFTKDSIATLTAVPADGYRFGEWGGDVTAKVETVSVLMNGNKNITVSFVKTYDLTTAVSNTDGGTITPASGTYDEGTEVTLTALPATGYRFDSWGGDASGSDTTVKITLDADKTVTASFIKTYTLTVAVNDAAGGTVSDVSGTYDTGSTVTITATPAEGYVFSGWEGDITSTDATIEVTMNADKNITAKFTPQ